MVRHHQAVGSEVPATGAHQGEFLIALDVACQQQGSASAIFDPQDAAQGVGLGLRPFIAKGMQHLPVHAVPLPGLPAPARFMPDGEPQQGVLGFKT